MLETNRPKINVNELIDKIKDEIKRGADNSLTVGSNSESQTLQMNLSFSYIEALLKNAEFRSSVRTKWPDKLNKFPFNISLTFQNVSLKILKFLFRDQREVNLNLQRALRESVAINHQLVKEISALNIRIDEFASKTIVSPQLAKNPDTIDENQQQALSEEEHLLDAFYAYFEDEFRGSREEILNRLEVYLPLIEASGIGTHDTPILDVGCGRGEWLELLHNSGYVARGLDINRVMLSRCKARNLDVIESDVIAYLQSLPDASLGAITGFHIIEHLPFSMLVELIDETLRVLVPQGLVIFETPNPDNILVGSKTFYLDPTHRNPLPSPMIKFVAESRGMCRVKIMNLHPYPEKFLLANSDVAERFNEYFYGAQDYALIGYTA